jgi:CBS domain-containing protein
MKASEIMTKQVVTIKGSATVAQAIKLMKENNLRDLVVERRHEEDAFGIITETDIVYKVTAFGLDAKQVKIYEIMTKPCIIVNPHLSVEYVSRLFANTGIRQAPVVQGELLGIVSVTDILHRGDFVDKPKSAFLAQEIEKARNEAHRICAEKGTTSPECAAAWDIVEELQAEAAHQRAQKPQKTYFEQFCEENPDAYEARMYDS